MNNEMNYFKARQWAFSFIKENNAEPEAAERLLCDQMNWNEADLLLHFRDPIPENEWKKYQENVKKFVDGWPVKYLTGKAYFYGLQLKVNENTLIPRPETEELVQWILADNPDNLHLLQQHANDSAFMQSMLSNMEQVMAKTDIDIAKSYVALADDQQKAEEIFALILAEYQRSKDALLQITGQQTLLSGNRALARSLALRLPYLNALNWLQIALLKQRRGNNNHPESENGTNNGLNNQNMDDDKLLQLTHLTINGVAQGLRNTG